MIVTEGEARAFFGLREDVILSGIVRFVYEWDGEVEGPLLAPRTQAVKGTIGVNRARDLKRG